MNATNGTTSSAALLAENQRELAACIRRHDDKAAAERIAADGYLADLNKAVAEYDDDEAARFAARIAACFGRAAEHARDASALRRAGDEAAKDAAETAGDGGPRGRTARRSLCAICGDDISGGHCRCSLSEPPDGMGPQGEDYLEALAARDDF